MYRGFFRSKLSLQTIGSTGAKHQSTRWEASKLATVRGRWLRLACVLTRTSRQARALPQRTGYFILSTSPPSFAFGTFSIAGAPPFAGLVINEHVIALHSLGQFKRPGVAALTGCDSILDFMQNWDSNLAAVQQIVALSQDNHAASIALRQAMVPLTLLKVHAPLAPRQILCTGANYYKHVVDLLVDAGPGGNPGTEGMTPAELRTFVENLMTERAKSGSPYVFSKLPSAVTGPYDAIVLPAIARQPDWELELAVVIGKAARNVKRADAMQYVAGYTIVNDITSRDLIWCKEPKAMGTDWISAKNAPTFLPMGPYLVPASFVANPHDLKLTLKLNGDTMQDESSSDMIFDIARQIEYISSRIQLLPGDVICTGSPAGNGTHYHRFLRDGDVVETTITGLGQQRNPCVNEADQTMEAA